MLKSLTQRLRGKSAHPLADASHAAKLLQELPHDNPAQAIVEAAALLESLEGATDFDAANRLNVIAMIDEAAHKSVGELTLGYIGASPRMASGRLQDWRVLSDYLERLSTGYSAAIDEYARSPKIDDARLALHLSRAMRAITDKMRSGWVRYLPPDRASWEAMAKYYRLALGRKVATTMAKAYPTGGNTCPAYELAAAVMLTAAVPQSLTPREIEVICRVALMHAGAFARSATQEADTILTLDLDRPAPPALLRNQAPQGRSVIYFGAGSIAAKLAAFRGPQAEALLDQVSLALATDDKLGAIEHALKFWSPNPPSRRESRTPINTPIQVLIGVKAVQRALGHLAEVAVQSDLGLAPEQPVVHSWTLTDFSTHGIGARFARRPDGWLSVGSVIGFRLQRSPQWALGIVRRIRSDGQNQTDVGIEILAKSAELVALEIWDPGTSISSIVTVRSGAVLLPENPQLHNQPSLLLEPGTYNRQDTFILHRGSGARRARLASMTESLDGWNRVDLTWLDGDTPDTAGAEAPALNAAPV